MVDAPGKDTPNDPKPTEGKPAGKSGAVKPPVLEGTARPAASTTPPTAARAKPDSTTGSKPETRKSTATPARRAEAESESSPWLAGLTGGLIGLGAAYGLAFFGLWPSAPAVSPAADPRVAELAGTMPELQTITGTLQDELAVLNGRVSSLETGAETEPAAAPGVDMSALEAEVASLAAQIEEIAAQPAPQDDGGSEAAIAAVQEQLAAVETAAADTAAQVAEIDGRVASLAEATSSAAETSGGLVQLPLILSGLDSAFDAGRSYEAELSALRVALPDSTVPDAVASRASSGLPRPDAVQRRLTDAIPDMLAARPAQADAAWQDSTMDWLRGVVAMRPTGDVEGDGPDATVARLEAAVARGDYAAARTELDGLPEAMRASLVDLAADIEALAEADAFISDLRTEALGGGGGA